MKLEVGQYVRTNKGYIGKLKNHYLGSGTEKHSNNLIDLIEVGDYVNGERVGASRYGLYVGFDEMEEPFMLEDIKIYEILTHEQYEANCYKLGE